MTGKVTGQKSLFLSIRKRIFLQFLCIAVHTSLLQWIDVGFSTFWGNTAKTRVSLVPLALFWLNSIPCTHANGLRLWGYTVQWEHIRVFTWVEWELWDISLVMFREKRNLIQLCLQCEIGDAGLASKGEEEPSPCCLSLEMELLKCSHWNTLKPGIRLELVPFPKGKESQNYNILYNLLITAFGKASQEHPTFNSYRWKSLIWAVQLLNPCAAAAGC